MAAKRWLSGFVSLMCILPADVRANFCGPVFRDIETLDVEDLLFDRYVQFSEAPGIAIIHPSTDGSKLNQLAAFVKTSFERRLILVTAVSSSVADDDFVIYLPRIFIKISDVMSVDQLQDLIYNDWLSQRASSRGQNG